MRKYKIFGLIAPIRDISLERFHDHYRHPHGTLALKIATLGQYVQSHRVPSDLLDSDQTRFEAIAEIGMDSIDDVKSFRQEPNLIEHILPDEPNFADLPAARCLLARKSWCRFLLGIDH